MRVFAFCLVAISFPAAQSAAWEWPLLWANADQRGGNAFGEEDYAVAAALFEDIAWRAASNYRNGDYQAALSDLTLLDDTTSHYNRANSLTMLNRLEEALAVYDLVLDRQPEHEDALWNRAVVEEMLRQQLAALEEPEYIERDEGEEAEEEVRAQDDRPPPPPNARGDEENREDTSEQVSEEESQDADNNTGNSTLDDPETAEEQEFSAEVEEELSVRQWLGRIRDEPGILLKNKFQLQREADLAELLVPPEEGLQPW